jgi:hypothetical protein
MGHNWTRDTKGDDFRIFRTQRVVHHGKCNRKMESLKRKVEERRRRRGSKGDNIGILFYNVNLNEFKMN